MVNPSSYAHSSPSQLECSTPPSSKWPIELGVDARPPLRGPCLRGESYGIFGKGAAFPIEKIGKNGGHLGGKAIFFRAI